MLSLTVQVFRSSLIPPKLCCRRGPRRKLDRRYKDKSKGKDSHPYKRILHQGSCFGELTQLNWLFSFIAFYPLRSFFIVFGSVLLSALSSLFPSPFGLWADIKRVSEPISARDHEPWATVPARDSDIHSPLPLTSIVRHLFCFRRIPISIDRNFPVPWPWSELAAGSMCLLEVTSSLCYEDNEMRRMNEKRVMQLSGTSQVGSLLCYCFGLVTLTVFYSYGWFYP